MKKLVILGLCFLPILANAKFYAIIDAKDKVIFSKNQTHTPLPSSGSLALDWYSFLESDCSYSGGTSLNNLSEWQSIGEISCQENIMKLPNVGDLTSVNGNLTIGSPSYFYNAPNASAFSGLKTVNGSLTAYVKGTGVSFNDYSAYGPTTLNLGSEGLGELNVKNHRTYTLNVNGIESIKSNLTKIDFEASEINSSEFPFYFNNLNIGTLTTTNVSGASYLDIKNSYISDLNLSKNYTTHQSKSNTNNNSVFINNQDIFIKNLAVNNVDNFSLNTSYTVTAISPYLLSNIEINNSYVEHYVQKYFNNIDKIQITDSYYKNMEISNGKIINEIIENNVSTINESSIVINNFDKINKINIKDSGFLMGNTVYSANSIDEVNIINTEKKYLEINSNNPIKIFNYLDSGTSKPNELTRLSISSDIDNMSINKKYLGNIAFEGFIDNLTINNVVSLSDEATTIEINKGVNNLSITVDPLYFESLTLEFVNATNPLSSLNITNNTEKMIQLSSLNATTLPDISILSNINGVNVIYNDYIDNSTFPVKLGSESVFCQNYGITTTFSYGNIDKSFICE